MSQKNDFILPPFQSLLIDAVHQLNRGMQAYAMGNPFPLYVALRSITPQLPEKRIKEEFYPKLKKDIEIVESYRNLHGVNDIAARRKRNEMARQYLLTILETRVDELSSLLDKAGLYTKIRGIEGRESSFFQKVKPQILEAEPE
jgi:hypothetical protein